MNSSIASSFIKNPIASSLLALAIWIVGAFNGSIALMVVAGIVAYGRPLLYSALSNSETKSEKSAKAGFGSFTPLRPSAAGAR